jgi:hypothetical protein
MKFNAALDTLLQDKIFVDKLLERGAIPLTSTPEQMRVLIEKEKNSRLKFGIEANKS